ncbi:short-chain dehydrogenase reductase sdr [Pyrenophora seminiperda CCB06]|uniref:Short-chain dehydrogenase reductase sdr n=1 Tax=Pyrenophora seminiperda CCB06 TaxID=1302712 RepID=A0A3M7MBI6_9PLEO|nr:short-chain dehydrogenase reductase sdr [Pyrenophora seminiperda CCB06]
MESVSRVFVYINRIVLNKRYLLVRSYHVGGFEVLFVAHGICHFHFVSIADLFVAAEVFFRERDCRFDSFRGHGRRGGLGVQDGDWKVRNEFMKMCFFKLPAKMLVIRATVSSPAMGICLFSPRRFSAETRLAVATHPWLPTITPKRREPADKYQTKTDKHGNAWNRCLFILFSKHTSRARLSSSIPADESKSADDAYLAKPSGHCCLKGTLHKGEGRGKWETIANVETYISVPPPNGKKANGNVLLYFPDVWGMFPNGLLVMDAFADAGYTVLGLDYFRGDPVWKHRKNRHDTSDPHFDYEAWKRKHTAFADEVVPKWVSEVVLRYRKEGSTRTRFACVGYCFGAPYVCDELAKDRVTVGAFAHPAFLKEHHFRNIEKPLFLSCSERDHTFDVPSRQRALDILQEGSKTYHYQLFSGVEHGFALRGNPDDLREHDCCNITPPRALDFTGDVAIVTGAGSRMDGEIGNGRATAILLARHGAKVALLDYNVDWAQETKRMIDDEGGVSEVIQTDVTNEESCTAAVNKTVELFGAVHILVNMVGVGGAMGDATVLNLDAWERDFRINVTSMVLMSRLAIPEMRRQGRGSIVNMSSVSGLLGGNPSLLYPTTKGAIIQMTRAMAAQHGRENIRVNCVCPGMVYTPMTRGRGMTDEMREARINQNLMKKEGTGWDVGYGAFILPTCVRVVPILFLSSKEAKWITGLIMPVDGGTTAGKADRPALKPDTLAETTTGVRN